MSRRLKVDSCRFELGSYRVIKFVYHRSQGTDKGVTPINATVCASRFDK